MMAVLKIDCHRHAQGEAEGPSVELSFRTFVPAGAVGRSSPVVEVGLMDQKFPAWLGAVVDLTSGLVVVCHNQARGCSIFGACCCCR